MKTTHLITIGAFLLLSACAAGPEVQAKRTELEQTTPICNDEKDCTAKWEAAQLWVVHHSAYKIQTATNVLIETFNPGESDTGLAVRVTKEPMGGGKYKILVSTWCNNVFGCLPNQWDAALDFNKTISLVVP